MEKIQEMGRARVVWRKVEARMKSRKIPLRRQLIFRLEEDIPKSVTRRALREALKESSLEPELERWISREMKILSKPSPTFFNLRNAGASLRNAEMKDIRADFETSEKEIIEGQGFKRIAGCSRNPD